MLPGEEGDPPAVERSLPAKGFLYERVSGLFSHSQRIAGGYVAARVLQGEGMVGFQLIKLPQNNTVIGLSGQPNTEALELFSAQLAHLSGFYTNVKLVNLSEREIEVKLQASNDAGTSLGPAVNRRIPSLDSTTGLLEASQTCGEKHIQGGLTLRSGFTIVDSFQVLGSSSDLPPAHTETMTVQVPRSGSDGADQLDSNPLRHKLSRR